MELRFMQAKGLTHLTLTELHSCQAYFQSLFFAILNIGDQALNPKLKQWSSRFMCHHKNLLSHEWLRDDSSELLPTTTSVLEAQEFSRFLFKTLEGLIVMEVVSEEKRNALYTLTLNKLFQDAHELHLLANQILGERLDIQVPRVLMMDQETENSDQQTQNVIPLYQINKERLAVLSEVAPTSVQSIELQREKRFERLIDQAHELIAAKNITMAKDVLEKALNYQETALAYNLLSWCHSLEGDIKTAKSLCMKAIKTDPAHGAAYNDLGSYLLAEGEVNESLKWFELAKNARQYQNREYAFINAGRAYVQKRDFKKAFKEFSLALTLAPENEELHKTVNHLKETLNRSKIESDDELPAPLF